MTPEQLAKSGSEDAHQAAVFAWANMAMHYGFAAAWDMACYANIEHAKSYGVGKLNDCAANLTLLFAIPNGGERHIAVASRLKATGVKKGVPDMCLPVPMQNWHGLYIELKKFGGKPSEEQIDWNRALTLKGYRVYLCEGWEMACRSLQYYLQGQDVYVPLTPAEIKLLQGDL